MDGSKVFEWVGEAVAASLVGWVTANARIGSKLAAQKTELLGVVAAVESRSVTLANQTKTELTTALREAVVELQNDHARLERDLENLEKRAIDERVQSATDHKEAAALAKSLDEVRAQSARTNDTLQRVLGFLQQGKGLNA